MAAITSAGSGTSSNTATWVGGIVPVLGDKVTIAATHVVTLDATHTWGDDTVTAITVNGTLKSSRTVNSSLTCYGELVIGATGEFDFGKTLAGSGTADQIPLGVTATLLLNNSAALAICKYGITTVATSKFYCAGATKIPQARLTANAAISATSIQVDQTSGWQVGDTVYIAASSTANFAPSVVTITGAITGSAGAFIVPVTALPKAHLSGIACGNATSNVMITSFNVSFPSYNVQIFSTATPPLTRELSYSLHKNLGQSANTFSGGAKNAPFGINGSGSSVYGTAAFIIVGCAFDNFSNPLGHGCLLFSYRPRWLMTDSIVVAGLANNALLVNGAVVTDLYRVHVIGGNRGFWSSNSQGAHACRFYNCCIHGTNGDTINTQVALAPKFYSCSFDTSIRLITSGAAMGVLFDSCDIGKIGGFANTSLSITQGLETFEDITLINCQIAPGKLMADTTTTGAKIQECTAGSKITVTNKNADPLQQEVYTKTGPYYRDNTQLIRSRSSIRFEPITANTPHGETFSVSATAGTPTILRFGLRYDTTYGTATPPSITVSGLGITPQTFTAGISANTDYEQAITVTPVSSGNLSIVIIGQTTSTTGKYWASGFSAVPFIDWSYHYGYQYNPSSSVQTVDSVVQLSQAAAGALTGLSYSAGTLTISSDHSIHEVYDWLKWYETYNQLAPIITSADGTNYILGANLNLNAALTGSGALTLGVDTLTVTGGSSTLPITHATGVLTLISLTGIQSGSRVQIYDLTSTTELYNGITGVSLSIPVTWTVNHNIRVRATYCVGLSAYLAFEQTGVLTSSGMSMQLTQVVDTVYNTNAINGSLVTEFTPDFTNVLVDVSTTGGITSPQRAYAWYAYMITLPAGIAGFFNALYAEDTVDYRINSSLVNIKFTNISTVACMISGGRIYCSDGTSPLLSGVGPLNMDSGKAYLANAPELVEVHARLGLNSTEPLTTTKTDITFGTVHMTMADTGTAVVVTRLP